MNTRIRFKNLWLLQLLSDLVAITASYACTYYIKFHSSWGIRLFTWFNRFSGIRDSGELPENLKSFYLDSTLRIVLILSCSLCLLYALRDLYAGRRFIRKRLVTWNIILSNVIALVLFYIYFYLRRNVFHPRSYFLTLIIINIIITLTFRGLLAALLHWVRRTFNWDQHSVIILGNNKDAEYIRRIIDYRRPHGLKVVDMIKSGRSYEAMLAAAGKSCRKSAADTLILADKSLTIDKIMIFLEMTDRLGVRAKVLSDKMGIMRSAARLPVDVIHGIPLVHFDARSGKKGTIATAAFISKVGAALMLLPGLPLMLLIALLIKLTSKGPVFFRQERIGVNRRPFMMYKFRTMSDKADQLQSKMEKHNEAGNGLFKIKKDARITPVGSLLRRFSLDELPQLLNVVRGEMNIVGPRPLPRRDFDNYYEKWHYSRHAGMPGLTCLWQISGRSELDFHNMCLLDVYYLRNHTWLLDLKIFIKTFWVVIFGRGAY